MGVELRPLFLRFLSCKCALIKSDLYRRTVNTQTRLSARLKQALCVCDRSNNVGCFSNLTLNCCVFSADLSIPVCVCVWGLANLTLRLHLRFSWFVHFSTRRISWTILKAACFEILKIWIRNYVMPVMFFLFFYFFYFLQSEWYCDRKV